MRIGFLGNMNNAAFSTARYFRDKGYDCEVLMYEDEPEHFAPDQDSFTDDYKSFTRRLEWGDPAGFLRLSPRTIENDIRGFNIIIGNGPAPAAMQKIQRRLDIFTPFGYDLYSLPFYKFVHPFRIPAYWRVASLQRKGIIRTPYIFFDKTNKEFEKLIAKFNYPGKRIVCPIPMIYQNEFSEEKILQNKRLHPFFDQLEELRSNNEVIFLQHIRQVWKNSVDPWALKGNDLLIKAYQKFLGRHASVRSKLILFEYGIDVQATKKLITELGISKNVVWLPRLARKFVMITLHYADLIIGELKNSWMTYGAMSEALCAGKPFMHKRIDSEYEDDYKELYPMIYADCEETVLSGLEGCIHQQENYKQIGLEGNKWFLKYLIEQPMEKILNVIHSSYGSNSFKESLI